MKLSEIFNKSQKLIQSKEIFDDSKVINILLNKELRKAEIYLKCNKIVSKELIFNVAMDIKESYQLNVVKIFTRYDKELFDESYYKEILYYIEKKYMHLYYFVKDSKLEIDGDTLNIILKGNGVDILIYNELDKAIASLISDEFSVSFKVKFISNIKPMSVEDKNKFHIEKQKEIIDRIERMPVVPEKPKKEEPKKTYTSFNKISYKKMDISSLSAESGKVEIEGEIFKIERKDFNNSTKGKVTFFVTDYKNSCICQIMDKLDEEFPQYGFKKHKGYVTKLHREMIKKYGVTIHHRKTFAPVKEIIDRNKCEVWKQEELKLF